MNRTTGAVAAIAVIIGFFLVTGLLAELSSTPRGVFGIVAVMAALLVLARWYTGRRR